jgi:hypothetical protein
VVWPKWIRKTGSGAKAVAQSELGKAIGAAAIVAASPRAAAILKAVKEAKSGDSISDKLDELIAEEKANGEKLDAILATLSAAVEE